MRIGKKIAIVSILTIVFLYRSVARWIVTPSAVRASWVEPLADASYFRSRPELPTFGRPPEELYQHFDTVREANDQKRRLFRAAQSGQGKVGLLRRYSTVEGRPIRTWLLEDGGRVTYVHDHTGDEGAPATAVDTHTPKNMKLGFLSDRKFLEGEPGTNDSQKVVLELDFATRSKVYFH
jgi:hypothetical protein